MKKMVKKFLRQAGVDVIRITPRNSDPARLQMLLKYHGVDLILDIGANVGQYALSLREHGYHGRIVSFEPLSSAYAELARRCVGDSAWEIAPRMAIGREQGQIEINIAGNSYSSSVLTMLDAHLDAAPRSQYIGKEGVPIATLDSVVPTFRKDAQAMFLKIDTQGYESAVLDGASMILERDTVGLQLELSLLPLYAGQASYLDLIQRLRQLNFSLHAVLPGFTDPHTGRLLQMDGIFFRS